jgi:tRNA U34 5-carboxymethylaminomethyl modifying GTPase MnmE/TrmE
LTRVLVQLHYTQKVDFAQLKSELQLHEKNDLTLMKQENDQLRGDVEKLKQRLREEITRTMAGVRLDLNLEKGRIRDESSQQELKIKEVDTRIESEIAGLRTQIEQAKFSILQYLVGVATGAGALLVSLQICSNAMTNLILSPPTACLSQNVQVITLL